MSQQTLFLALFALAGMLFTVGALLQWMTLRKYERLIQELRQRDALQYADADSRVSSLPDDAYTQIRASRRQ